MARTQNDRNDRRGNTATEDNSYSTSARRTDEVRGSEAWGNRESTDNDHSDRRGTGMDDYRGEREENRHQNDYFHREDRIEGGRLTRGRYRPEGGSERNDLTERNADRHGRQGDNGYGDRYRDTYSTGSYGNRTGSQGYDSNRGGYSSNEDRNYTQGNRGGYGNYERNEDRSYTQGNRGGYSQEGYQGRSAFGTEGRLGDDRGYGNDRYSSDHSDRRGGSALSRDNGDHRQARDTWSEGRGQLDRGDRYGQSERSDSYSDRRNESRGYDNDRDRSYDTQRNDRDRDAYARNERSDRDDRSSRYNR